MNEKSGSKYSEEENLVRMKLEKRIEVDKDINTVYSPVLDYASEAYHQSHISSVQDEFYALASALKSRGILHPGMSAYLPAANIQIETGILSSMFSDVDFIGGDIVKPPVVEGKKRIGASNNVHFMIGDAFFVPVKPDIIIDYGGAMWYGGLSGIDNFRYLFYQYHKVLQRGGSVILDRRSMRMIKSLAPELFEEAVKNNEVRFDIGGYKVRFKAKPLNIKEDNYVWLFEKT